MIDLQMSVFFFAIQPPASYIANSFVDLVAVINYSMKLNLYYSVNCGYDPCRNGGTCLDLGDTAICKCLPGYTGSICQGGRYHELCSHEFGPFITYLPHV